ncbi:phenylacetate-coenzyme A ligase [Flexivirga endophytica]|uniref:Phenylacetate-coenzyme A ligase n=1 Tax=Flexivirga endophytica TaxID=1849103 RepID=A0A916WT87_9MICO|nr:phenylacetate--CoA ligase PaaK [Flexivirga endophytica]GGB30628.1 phenylacetate-coenzyme A ligase [Flexivirga endophytica]GHB51539.1 phenylacetate-coenzyme A ligase [Flexivirga endophytica]
MAGAELDAAEKWSVDELRAHQLARLQETVAAAYKNVPHYRNALDTSGVHPNDIKDLADVRLLPFTGKADLRDNYPFGMFAVPRSQVVRIHASSGTTGMPTVVGYTQADIDTWADLVARSLRAAGVRPGDICQVSYGYGLFTGGLGAHYGAERLGCTVVPMSGGQTAKQVQLLRDFGARAIMVTPSYFLSILDEMTTQGIDPRELPLQVGVFGAEPWTDAMRAEIEERAGIDAVDIYGLSEVMGPGVAMECVETKDGPTIWEDHFLPEIIDPVTGDPVADGEEGELVFTSLTKQAMPVLRYRTRDLTRLLPGTARPSFRRMAKITGRSDDLMIIRGVNVFPTQIEELALAYDGLSPYFQCVLSRPGRLDEMTVNVEAAEGFSSDLWAQVETDLARDIKDRIGTTAKVTVLPVGGIERSVGKARRIVDNRPK